MPSAAAPLLLNITDNDEVEILSSGVNRINFLTADTERSLSAAGISSIIPSIFHRKVGIVFDDRMMRHKCEHDDDHPEQPARIQAIHTLMRDRGLVELVSQ